MKYGPFTEKEIKRQCKIYRETHQRDRPFKNFVVLQLDGRDSKYGVKMAISFCVNQLEQERDWMKFLSNNVDSKKIVVPKAYGIIEDKFWALLVMENISSGETIRQYMDREGGDLPADVADTIASTLVELRNILRPISDMITPRGGWTVQGTMFRDNETSKLVNTVQDMAVYITDRFDKAGVSRADLPPLWPMVYTHGDPSSRNFMILPDGRMVFLDPGMSCFAPVWWEWYAFEFSSESEDYYVPLMKAFKKHGLVVSEESRGVLDIFRIWYWRYGCYTDL